MTSHLFTRSLLTSAAVALLVAAGCSATEPGVMSAAPEPQSQEQIADLAPSIAKPAGLETKTEVVEALTPEARMTALEKAVAQLQTDMEANKTEIARLPEIENKLGLILAEVKGLKVTPQPVTPVTVEPVKVDKVVPAKPPAPPAKKVEAEKVAAKPAIVKDVKKEMTPPPAKPEIKVEKEKPETKADPIDKIVDEAVKEKSAVVQKAEPVKESAKPGPPAITQVRVGEHADKTRIVLESTAPISFSTDLDNSEKIILVDLKNTGWSAAKEQKLASSPFVSSYAVQADGTGGQRLVMTLKKAVKLKSYAIKAEGTQPDRLVLDLVSGP